MDSRIADNIPGALYELKVTRDADVRFTFLSEGFGDFGVPRDRAMRDFNASFAATHPDDLPALMEAMQQAFIHHVPFKHEYRVRLPGGQVRWLRSQATPREQTSGDVHYYGWFIDITEQKELEAQLAEARNAADLANRAKSVFLATMSHEIRTPMVGITSMLEVLSYSGLTPQQRHQLRVIEESAQMMLKIIGDILDFSKIEAGRMELSPLSCSLGALVQGTAENFLPAASAKGLRLSCEVDGKLAFAHLADAVRVRQVLSNFLANALKFTPSGSIEIRIDVVEDFGDRQRVRIRVKDSGIGVSPEAQGRLFEPFVQAEAGTTRQFGGTGLGLAICRHLARLMDGDVSMQSEPGRGTTVSFTAVFPVGSRTGAEAPEPAPAPRGIVLRRKPSRRAAEAEGSLLLLAEDHPTNRLVLARQLDLAGFVVDIAEDGEQALELFKAGRYALVVTDLHMPRVDGFQLTAAIRELERREGRPPVPVLALTAAVMQEEVTRCMELGMNDVLTKPVTVRALVEKLRQWLPHLSWTGDHVERRRGEERRRKQEARRGLDRRSGPARRRDEDRRSGEERRGPADGPAAEPGGDASPLDLALLRTLTGGDSRLEASILRDFLKSTHEDLRHIREHLQARDLHALTRQAHRLKGAALIVGAGPLAELALRVERAGLATNWDGIPAAVQEVERAFGTLMAAIEARLAG